MKGLFNGEPKPMAALHKWLTILWFIAAFPVCIFLSTSVPFLVFISVYAVVASHWASWQATQAELKQDEANGNGS